MVGRQQRRHGRGIWSLMAFGLLVASIALAGCGGSSGDEKSGGSGKLRVAMTASATNLAVWVADQQGFFKNHGLAVDIEILASPSLSKVPQVLGRQYDIAQITAPGHIVAANAGLPIVAVCGGYKVPKGNANTVMMVKPDSGIKTAKDLVGKRIVVPTISGNTNTAAMYWLIKEGVDPKSVKLVEASSPDMPDLLNSGRVDAGEITSPFVGVLDSEGFVTVGNFLEAVSNETQMSYWAAQRSWAEKNRDVIQKYRAALADAAKWISENHDPAVSILMKETNVPEKMRPYITLPVYTTELTVDDMDAWLTAMKAVTGFKTDLKMSDLILK